MTELRHPTREQIELFILGDREQIPVAELEEHFSRCDRCAGELERQARLELELGEVANAASFCPGCERMTDELRCAHCGCALQPGGYRVDSVLVQTPHGRIYLARSEEGRRVALKELVFTQVPSLSMVEAFEREGRLLQQLRHDRIPRFYASFTEGEGVHTRLYLAQEYVEGESLASEISKRRFDEAEVVQIARGVLEILCYLQSLSPPVFHRDIKPSNLILRPGGGVVLVDFGSARDLGATAGGTLAGTFGYMPLEQMVGVVDATSDLYALGATMCHLLSRTPPWRLLEGGLAPGKMSISMGMKRFLQRMTAQKPEARYSGATEALDALDTLSNTPRAGIPRRVPYVLAAVAALGLVGGTGYWIGSPSHVQPVQPVQPVVQATREVPKPTALTIEAVPVVPVVPPVPPVRPVDPVPPVDPVDPVDPVEPVRPLPLPRPREARAAAVVAQQRARARDFANRARKALMAGDLTDAEEGFKDCLRLAELPECYRNLGVLYAQQKDGDKSIKYYRKYLEISPNAQDADYIRGMIEGTPY